MLFFVKATKSISSILGLSLLGYLLLWTAEVKAEPLCFMITDQHQIINLDHLCLSPSQPEAIAQTPSPNLDSTTPDEENGDKTEQDPLEVRKLQEIAVAPEVLAEDTKLPPILEGIISKEMYDNRPRCQMLIERMETNPYLRDPFPVSSINTNRPVLQELTPLSEEMREAGAIVNRGGHIGICKYRM